MMKAPKKIVAIVILCAVLLTVISTIAIQIKKSQEIYDADLVKPSLITADNSLNKAAVNKMIHVALLFYTFWNTGEYKYLNAAIAPTFMEHTLPKDTPKSSYELKLASNQMRAAIPDLRCTVEELLISSDKITARLVYSGTSKGLFMGTPATGKPVKFAAIDILHIQNGKLVEDWHLEDTLSLLEQLNVVHLKS
jgi:predicted ester cyclase